METRCPPEWKKGHNVCATKNKEIILHNDICRKHGYPPSKLLLSIVQNTAV
jgi:hypothetical protein